MVPELRRRGAVVFIVVVDGDACTVKEGDPGMDVPPDQANGSAPAISYGCLLEEEELEVVAAMGLDDLRRMDGDKQSAG